MQFATSLWIQTQLLPNNFNYGTADGAKVGLNFAEFNIVFIPIDSLLATKRPKNSDNALMTCLQFNVRSTQTIYGKCNIINNKYFQLMSR